MLCEVPEGTLLRLPSGPGLGVSKAFPNKGKEFSGKKLLKVSKDQAPNESHFEVKARELILQSLFFN